MSLIRTRSPRRKSASASATARPAGRFAARAILLGVSAALLAAGAWADDPDNCLLCHRFRGLSRYDAEQDRVHLYYTDPHYQTARLGAHARIACTDCHRRDEVGVIPHQPTTPVDCTNTCHLHNVEGVARRFSHAETAHQLEASVHSPETLAKIEFGEGPLLAPNQSYCLYCHDEPVYRRPSELIPGLTMLSDDEFSRCYGCHQDQLPQDIPFSVRHVTSRLQRSRPPLEQAQACSICHADATVLAQFDIPDSVGSFIRSYHGKAALLGDHNAANCVSCHVRSGRDAHLILARNDPGSAVNPDNVANSCRSTRCHPGADPAIGSTGVHLDLPTFRGNIEFIVAAAFILLTLGSFGPSLVICLLELAQIAIGRHGEHNHRSERLARAVLAHPAGRARLWRFTVSQRMQHWVLVVLFTTLVITGFPMKFAHHFWARPVIDILGGLGVARFIHHWAGVALVGGFLLHAVYAILKTIGNARRLRPDGRPQGLLAAIWDMPMLIRPSDLLKANQLMAYLLGMRKHPPTFGRFSIKEKFEYLGVGWGTMLLGVTGLMLWNAAFFTRFLDGRVFNIALIAHTYEAFLAVIHVYILHIVNVMFSPHVFPLSPATITGDTPLDELADQHSEFVEEAAADLGVRLDGGPQHD